MIVYNRYTRAGYEVVSRCGHFEQSGYLRVRDLAPQPAGWPAESLIRAVDVVAAAAMSSPHNIQGDTSDPDVQAIMTVARSVTPQHDEPATCCGSWPPDSLGAYHQGEETCRLNLW